MDLNLIETSTNGIYGKGSVNVRSGKRHKDCISPLWMQSFADRFRVVSRRQRGKLQLSPVEQKELEQEIPKHLRRMKIGFETGNLEENNMSNADETYF